MESMVMPTQRAKGRVAAIRCALLYHLVLPKFSTDRHLTLEGIGESLE